MLTASKDYGHQAKIAGGRTSGEMFRARGDLRETGSSDADRLSGEMFRALGDLGVSLTRSASAVTPGSGVWRVRFDPAEHGAALARHVRVRLGVRTAALLAAEGSYGDRFMGSFWDAFVDLGGEVIAAERFQPGRSNEERRALVQRVFGLRAPDGEVAPRPDAMLLVGRGRSGGRQREDLLEMKSILSHAKSLGIPIRTDPSRSGPVQVLGDATWNDRMAIDLGEYLTNNVLFVDGYVDGPGPGKRDRFRSRFYAAASHLPVGDRRPTTLDAISYDATQLLARHLEGLDGDDHGARLDLASRIGSAGRFHGVTGTIDLTEGEGPGRSPWILTVDGDEIRARRDVDEDGEQPGDSSP